MIIRLVQQTPVQMDFVYILQQLHVQARMDVVQPNVIQGMIMIVNLLVGVEEVLMEEQLVLILVHPWDIFVDITQYVEAI
jgi:hypothetical protein